MRPGRNDACPCGSGRKFKRCCGSAQAGTEQLSSPVFALDRRAAFDRALAYFRAGDPTRALEVCARILEAEPDHVDALNLTGVIAWRRDDFGWAEEYFRRAIRSRPLEPQFHMNLGALYREQGRAQSALEALREALRLDSGYREARLNLVLVLSDLGRDVELGECIVRLAVDWPGVSGGLTAAAQLALAGKHREAAMLLALVCERCGPDPALVTALATALTAAGDATGAERVLRTALASSPGSAGLYSALGAALLQQLHLTEAESALKVALEHDPDHREAHFQMARVQHQSKRAVAAELHARAAVAAAPGSPEAHFLLGEVLLSQGRFAEGWSEYEWRWQEEPYVRLKRSLPRPPWSGEDLAGRTVLVHFEQGLGDTIQFSRYLLELQASGGRVVFLCQPVLKELFRASFPGVHIVDRHEDIPPHDCYCPLISLPRLFGTTLETVPGRAPYLEPDPQAVKRWRQRFAQLKSPRVGLVWSGNPRYGADAQRSIPWSTVEPYLHGGQVQWVSLQKRDIGSVAHLSGADAGFEDAIDECADFADTAALVGALDLVVGVDTAVIHLAGAMGKPVWLLNRHAGDWRWLEGRTDSPWYPTLRVFRQETSGDWSSVLGRVTAELREWAAPVAKPAPCPVETAPPTPRTGHLGARVGSQRGFTLLGVLFLIALTMLGASALGTFWSSVAQREREAELLFVGKQYKQALESYARNSPGAPQFPRRLEDLLQDNRTGTLKRHLRQLFPDPMTGQANWGLVKAGDRIAGIHSLSAGRPFKIEGTDDTGSTRYSDWKFVAELAPKDGVAAAGATSQASPPAAPASVSGVPGPTAGPVSAPADDGPSNIVKDACERMLRLETSACEGRRGYPGVTRDAVSTCLETAAARAQLCLQGQAASAPPLAVPEIKR